MYQISIWALAKAPTLEVKLMEADLLLESQDVAKGEDIMPALDNLLKGRKLNPTNVIDITVHCEDGASQLSCQMAKVARETFLFARTKINSNIAASSSK